MLSPRDIYSQMVGLTVDLIALGLCNDQRYPSEKRLRNGLIEVGFGESHYISIALKDMAYCDIYDEMDRNQAYNMRMLDGALVQMLYRFQYGGIIGHRLAFFPSPRLEQFQNDPDLYLQDEIYADIVAKSIVPFPLRFDFNKDVAPQHAKDHPKSHLTLGQYKNCRIPVSAPLTPSHFIGFILRSFYYTAYKKYHEKIHCSSDCFEITLEDISAGILYVNIP